MDRRSCIEKYINIHGVGLEIGAGYNPFFPKKNRYNVMTLDHASTEDLKTKYGSDKKVNISNIEEVDFVWKGEPYAQLMPGQRFDWIFASHVVEHTPNIVGFINNCASVLHSDGVLALAIPDKRYTFDFFRERSSLSAIIDAHTENRTKPSTGNLLESLFFTLTEANNGSAWSDLFGSYRIPSPQYIHRDDFNPEYRDVHVWAFTPHHMRMIIEILFKIGLISLREAAFYPTSGCEFFMFLAKNGNGPAVPLPDLATMAKKEQARHIFMVGSGTHWPRGVLASLDRLFLRTSTVCSCIFEDNSFISLRKL